MNDWINLFSELQQGLFESVVGPMVFKVGLGGRLEDAFVATGWLLVGVIQLLVLVCLIGPLQRLWPVEAVTDRATVRTDMIYTLIHRLGLFRLVMFFAVTPLVDDFFGLMRVAGLGTFQLDDLVPGLTDLPLVSLLIYLLVFDLADYWIHRGQHQVEWWWRLHALHHAQRQMTMWSDNRNHLLDDLIRDLLLVSLAHLIGVAPGQFVAIVVITQLSENFQHANLRLWFGRWGERLWISPRFHRMHHSIGVGHESGGRQTLGGCNFGVLFPWWDMLWGTANFEHRFEPTGVRDQVEQGREYGRGFWSQQWQGVLRLMGRA